MFRVFPLLVVLLISLIICSCSDEEDVLDVEDNIMDNRIQDINLPEQLGLDSGEVKMFTMPTPLQIATALKLMDVHYNESLMLPHGNIRVISDIDLSLALGMYLTDLGYVTVYNHPQKSLIYAKDIQFIMEELPISLYVNDGFRKRFKANIDNQDSLCKIILEGYNEANQHISETENEALGLLILTGSYIEGLHLATSSNVSKVWIEENNNILIQQKLFLDNFITLLDGYKSTTKINVVMDYLSQLKIIFDEIEIKFNDKTESYELKSPISPTDRVKIKALITELRNEMKDNIYIK